MATARRQVAPRSPANPYWSHQDYEPSQGYEPIGDITRFATPAKLVGYTGLCPSVDQSGGHDRRGELAKNGPKYLRWALIEAATHAARHPVYRDRYQRTRTRLGRQRGASVARVDIARMLTEAIWHMLTTDKPSAPAGATPPTLPA